MTRKAYPSEAADRTQVRLSGGMREHLKAAAAANGRSMNAEIVMRLERSMHPPSCSPDESDRPRFLGASVRWAAPTQPAATLHGDIATIIDRHIEAEVEARVARIIAAIKGAR